MEQTDTEATTIQARKEFPQGTFFLQKPRFSVFCNGTPGSSNGRTADSESANFGSNPNPGTNVQEKADTLLYRLVPFNVRREKIACWDVSFRCRMRCFVHSTGKFGNNEHSCHSISLFRSLLHRMARRRLGMDGYHRQYLRRHHFLFQDL